PLRPHPRHSSPTRRSSDLRGARVVLVSGPVALPAPSGIELLAVRSAEEMARAVAARVGSATIVAMAAAVADYRPATVSPTKVKKDRKSTRLNSSHQIISYA